MHLTSHPEPQRCDPVAISIYPKCLPILISCLSVAVNVVHPAPAGLLSEKALPLAESSATASGQLV